eukprot:12211611-Ditylum_brightwellii.AAC.1
MSVDCAPFRLTHLKLLHCDQPVMLQSQHHAHYVSFGCLDTSHHAHRPPPAPDPPHSILNQACSTLIHMPRPPPEPDPVFGSASHPHALLLSLNKQHRPPIIDNQQNPNRGGLISP